MVRPTEAGELTFCRFWELGPGDDGEGDAVLEADDATAGDFVLEAGDFALKAGDFALETGDLILEAGDFALGTGDFVFEVGDFALETGDLALEAGDLPFASTFIWGLLRAAVLEPW